MIQKLLNLKSLKRETNRKKFIPEIDGIRFLAISTVVLYHLNTSILRNFQMGDPENVAGAAEGMLHWAFYVRRFGVGVPIFFSLSGFILALPFLSKLQAKSFPSLKDYFTRRLSRLEPPYLISLTVLFLVQLPFGPFEYWDLTKRYLSGLIYSHRLIYAENNPINPVTWSLATEAQFYLFLPLLFLISRHLRVHYLSVIFLAVALSIWAHYIFIDPPHYWFMQTIITKFSYFGSGIFFAHLYLNPQFQVFLKRKNGLWDIIFWLGLLFILRNYIPTYHWKNNLIFCVSIVFMMTAVFKGKLMNYFFTRPFVYTIGGMCYTIYLIHYAALHILTLLAGKLLGNSIDDWDYSLVYVLSILVFLPIVLAISIIFFRYFEKPFMNKDWPKALRLQLETWRLKLPPRV